MKSNWGYIVYALVLGIVSLFTHEIVTFVMLGFVLMSLNNINTTLQKIYNSKDDNDSTTN